MPAQASRFHVTLKDPDTAQKRFVTLSRVPCPTCENDPVLKGRLPDQRHEREDGPGLQGVRRDGRRPGDR
jgi:hypothetical protein